MEPDSKQPIKKYKLDPVSCFFLSFITYWREEKHPCIFLSEIKRQMLPFQWNGFWPSILMVALSYGISSKVLLSICPSVLSKKAFQARTGEWTPYGVHSFRCLGWKVGTTFFSSEKLWLWGWDRSTTGESKAWFQCFFFSWPKGF